MIGGKQDELLITALRVKIKIILKLMPDLRRVAGDVDVKVRELGAFPGEMLQRAVIAFDERGRGHLEEVAEHEAVADEAVHLSVDSASIIISRSSTMP